MIYDFLFWLFCSLFYFLLTLFCFIWWLVWLVTLGAIFMLYILLCCVNGSAQPDDTAQWLGQRSGIVGGEKPHRFYGECRQRVFVMIADHQFILAMANCCLFLFCSYGFMYLFSMVLVLFSSLFYNAPTLLLTCVVLF